jgi:peptide/nickel transport system substrate-binding protein
VAALETGQVDIVPYSGIPNVEVARVRQLPALAMTTEGYQWMSPILWLEINMRKAPLSDVRVRRAIAHAIDRTFILQNVWFGIGKVATGPLVSTHRGFYTTTEVPPYEYSLEKANRLLDEAGYRRGADGVRFKMTQDFLPYGDEWVRLAEYVREQLKKVGIDATTRTSDYPGWINRIFTQYDFDFTSDFVGNLPDPQIGMPRYYVSSMIKKGVPWVNSMNYQNPEIDRLFEQSGREMNRDRRFQLFHQIQRVIMNDVPLLPLLEIQFTTFYNKDLEGVVTGPYGVNDPFDRVYWKRPRK